MILFKSTLIVWIFVAEVVVNVPSSVARLTNRPRDHVTAAGPDRDVTLECGSDIQSPVNWVQRPALSPSQTNRIVFDGSIHSSKADKYRVKEQSFTHGPRFDLVIHSLNETDAGQYNCRDNKGYGDDFATAELVVVKRMVTCRTDVINVTADGDLELTEGQPIVVRCNFSSVGELVPRIIWKDWPIFAVNGLSNKTSGDSVETAISVELHQRAVGDDAAPGSLCRPGSYCSCTMTDVETPTGPDDQVYFSARIANCDRPAVVKFPVRNVRIEPTSQTGLFHLGDVLTCRADASPSPDFRWFNAVSGESAGRGPHLILSAAGKNSYICMASNSLLPGDINQATSLVHVVVFNDGLEAAALLASTAVPDMVDSSRNMSLTTIIVISASSAAVVSMTCTGIIAGLVVSCRRRRSHLPGLERKGEDFNAGKLGRRVQSTTDKVDDDGYMAAVCSASAAAAAATAVDSAKTVPRYENNPTYDTIDDCRQHLHMSAADYQHLTMSDRAPFSPAKRLP